MFKITPTKDGLFCAIWRKDLPKEYFFITFEEIKELASYLKTIEDPQNRIGQDWGN